MPVPDGRGRASRAPAAEYRIGSTRTPRRLASTATTAALKKQIEYLAAMQRQAREAIAARDREAERSIIEERLRIARDLHDAVGHEAAIVSVQISLAEVNLRKDPDAAAGALAEARGGVQGILHEMQRILEVLRFSESEDASRPTGGVSAVPELILSPFTVKTHVNRAMAKLAARDRAQLVAFWHAAGEPRE